MKKIFTVLGTLLFATSLTAAAGEMGTPDEAKAMSMKAADLVNNQGDGAFSTFAAADGGFQVKDLYVFCMDLEGKMLSHAKKAGLVGKNLKSFNKYGDNLFQDMISVASGKGEGWVDYRWPYPGSEEIKQKTSYIIKNQKGFFCGVGAYK
ncbi:MAG: histidine kinase [Gammaproteobacteria bacterium]|nr:histidine kinase [Gammaproteobacteria bacterium]